MSAILDMITGGGLLPHVYCKKVVLENHPEESSEALVTLHFELYQLASALGDSNWLNNFNVLGANIYDSMYIEVIPFRHPDNVKKLLASNNPTPAAGSSLGSAPPSDVGNVYVVKQQAGDGHLPRSDLDSTTGPVSLSGNPGELFSEPSDFGSLYADSEFWTPPIRMKSSATLQSLSGEFLESPESFSGYKQDLTVGQARQEVKSGQVYYVIPFQQSFRHNIADNPDLGFLFYTMLHVPAFFAEVEEFKELNFDFGDLLESYIIEGPVNTEIVFKNGKPAQTREIFTLYGDQTEVWEGSVHLHAKDYNPAPDGYAGNGGFGENGGWMTGEKHLGMADQPKLALHIVPNKKIQDFRSDISQQPYDGFMGLGVDSPVFSLNEDVQGAVKLFLSPFQKETRKYLSKFGDRRTAGSDAQYNAVGASYYDNDSEFSKLYLSRDRFNNARGMFFIGIQEFLRNNSKIFPILFDKAPDDLDEIGKSTIENERRKIVYDYSKILEIKLYRDRVKKKIIGTKREKYANDKSYEEPSYLVGTIRDGDTYATPNQTTGIAEIALKSFSPGQQRFFMFSDKDAGEKSAGLYQYRVEVAFQDGTYSYLKSVLKELVDVQLSLNQYYELATSYYSEETVYDTAPTTMAHFGSKKINKKRTLRPYFQNGSFVQQFKDDIETKHIKFLALWQKDFAETWYYSIMHPTVTRLLQKIKYVFGISSVGNGYNVESLFVPETGSPNGISFVAKLVDSVIRKLENLLDVNKFKKTGSELANTAIVDGYNLGDLFDYDISPSDTTIYDNHTFENLFEGLANENIYSDYLTVGTNLAEYASPAISKEFINYGLRRLNASDFTKRCQLDAAKFFNLHPITENWDEQLLGPTTGPRLRDTGYSYLTPSIIELSDSSQSNKYTAGGAYSFYYSAFTSEATRLGAGLSEKEFKKILYSENFSDYKIYDRLLFSLMSYSLNKKDTPDADLTDAFSIGPTNFDSGGAFDPDEIETRETYKNVFERYGLSVHKSSRVERFYGSGFEKAPGAISLNDKSDKEEYHADYKGATTKKGHWLDEDYSDGKMLTHAYLKQLLFHNKQNLIEKPEFTIPQLSYGQFLESPNAYKAFSLYTGNVDFVTQNQDIVQPKFSAPFESSANSEPSIWTAFMIFQMAMHVKVEVHTPSPAAAYGSPQDIGEITTPGVAKDDEGNWGLLKHTDMAGLSEGENLFCRLSPADMSEVGSPNALASLGINLPILDRYFIISGG